MNEKSKSRLALLAGVATGFVIGYYLSSEEGRGVREKIGTKLSELSGNLGEKVQETIDELSGDFSEAVRMGMDLVSPQSADRQSFVAAGYEPEEDFLLKARNSFLRGMERARRRIEEQS